MWLSLGYWFYGLGINTLNALQLFTSHLSLVIQGNTQSFTD